MTRIISSIFAVAALSVVTGCASNGNKTVSVCSSPKGAAIAVNGIDTKKVTPCKLELAPGQTYTITATKPGFCSGSALVAPAGNTLAPGKVQIDMIHAKLPIIGSRSDAAVATYNIEKLSDEDFKACIRHMNSLPK